MERRASISQWARETGINRKTLREWLIVDAGCVLEGPQRDRRLIAESHVEAALRAHTVRTDLTQQRRKRKAA